MKYTTAILVSLLALTSTAFAAEPRRPLTANESRVTEATIDQYEQPLRIVRERRANKRSVVFSAPAQPIEPNAIMLFVARSESPAGAVIRWRCVAEHDVAECLGDGVRIRYLDGEQRIVLEATLKARNTAEAMALLEEARAPLFAGKR
jgi:hypothetical protein